MKRVMVHTLACALTLVGALGFGSTAAAQASGSSSSSGSSSRSSAPASSGSSSSSGDSSERERPSASEYAQRVRAGMNLLTSGDTAGAIAAFRQAISADGSDPEAPFLMAEANRMAGNLDAALAGFRGALQTARSANNPRWVGRALMNIAFTLERMDGQLPQARTAWNEYVQWSDGHQQVSSPQIGRQRMQAIDVQIEQERAYVEVRQRIAARVQHNQQQAAQRAAQQQQLQRTRQNLARTGSDAPAMERRRRRRRRGRRGRRRRRRRRSR